MPAPTTVDRRPARTGRNRRAGIAILVAVTAVLAASCSDSKTSTSSPSTVASTAGKSDGSASAIDQQFVKVVQEVRPSVVEISTSAGLGSGVVYDDKGDIVTNAHVVGDATQFQVSSIDGKTVAATLVGTYPTNDLAVIKVPPETKLPAATFGDSSEVQVGEIAFAIGNPLGLSSSVTNGVVSATGRTVSEGGGVVLPRTIQTSAPINPGNGGGALVNLDAKVIGIPTLAATVPELGGGAAPGIGFAIASDTVKLIADQLIATGKVTSSGRAALGITAATAASLSGAPIGVVVRSVVSAGPANGAGIKPGDIITAINGRKTPTLDDLQTVMAELKPADTATVDVIHPNGAMQSYKVTLGSL